MLRSSFYVPNALAAMAIASALMHLEISGRYDCQLASQKNNAGRWVLPIELCPSNQLQCLSMYWVDWVRHPYLWYGLVLKRYGSRTDMVRAQCCLGMVSVWVIWMHGMETSATGTVPVLWVREPGLWYG